MEIGIYGLGRFGAFWGEYLSDHFTVKGYNRSSGREIPRAIRKVSEEEVFDCEALFYCVSISSFKEVLERTSQYIKNGTLIMDTCSVKSYPIQWMRETLPEKVRILGTHPMFGPDSAREGVEGLPVVLCPVRISEDDFSLWLRIFKGLGLEVLRMSGEEHDHQAAYTQGITHFIGRVLTDVGLKERPLSTLGFKKLLDVVAQTCNDPWQLFLDLQYYNPYTGEMRDNLSRAINKMMDQLKKSPGEYT